MPRVSQLVSAKVGLTVLSLSSPCERPGETFIALMCVASALTKERGCQGHTPLSKCVQAESWPWLPRETAAPHECLVIRGGNGPSAAIPSELLGPQSTVTACIAKGLATWISRWVS